MGRRAGVASTGQAADGAGWGLALLGVAFGYYAAPVMALVAAAPAITTRRSRSAGSIGFALILAATVLVLDAFLMTSREFRPRGPLG